jgi:hypothetical protein
VGDWIWGNTVAYHTPLNLWISLLLSPFIFLFLAKLPLSPPAEK